MAPLGNAELVQMLQAAAEGEHAAIIQYLRHAYLIGEGELACEIEGIAREEMRHFWILSRWIVRLGGQPTITRSFTDLSGATAPEWMQRDVAAEDRAIAMYQDYLARSQDPDHKADLEYILDDELRHRGNFAHFVDKTTLALQAAAQQPVAGGPEPAIAPVDLESLNWGVSHEYAAILQYLVHSFLLKDQDEEISSQLMTQAINEMQHMGWFGEALAGFGQELPLEPHPVTLPKDPQAMLEADVKLEHGTAAMYAEFIPKMVDPGAKGAIDDARGQELYHESLFTRLMKRLGAAAPSAKTWTIGALKRKED